MGVVDGSYSARLRWCNLSPYHAILISTLAGPFVLRSLCLRVILFAMTPHADHEILTVGEIAALLRVHPSTIYRLLKTGEIPAFKLGADWRFDAAAVRVWWQGKIGGVK